MTTINYCFKSKLRDEVQWHFNINLHFRKQINIIAVLVGCPLMSPRQIPHILVLPQSILYSPLKDDLDSRFANLSSSSDFRLLHYKPRAVKSAVI
jgi:hypothetical protein